MLPHVLQILRNVLPVKRLMNGLLTRGSSPTRALPRRRSNIANVRVLRLPDGTILKGAHFKIWYRKHVRIPLPVSRRFPLPIKLSCSMKESFSVKMLSKTPRHSPESGLEKPVPHLCSKRGASSVRSCSRGLTPELLWQTVEKVSK